MQIKVSIITVVLLFFITVTITLGFNNIDLQGQIEALEVEMDELEESFQTEALKVYVEELPEGEETPGYEAWKQAELLSEHFYDDSDGNFKKDWGRFLAIEAEAKGIDPMLVYELLRVETGGTFDPKTVGPETIYGHAYGLAQFMENTAPWIAEMEGLNYREDKLFDPYFSMQLAVTYLDFLYSQYGDWDYALTAYHRGIYGMQQFVEDNGHAKSWYAVEIQESAAENDLLTYDQ